MASTEAAQVIFGDHFIKIATEVTITWPPEPKGDEVASWLVTSEGKPKFRILNGQALRIIYLTLGDPSIDIFQPNGELLRKLPDNSAELPSGCMLTITMAGKKMIVNIDS